MTEDGVFRVIFETKRLVLSEMTAGDIGALAAILKDPEVMYACGYDFTGAACVSGWTDKGRDMRGTASASGRLS